MKFLTLKDIPLFFSLLLLIVFWPVLLILIFIISLLNLLNSSTRNSFTIFGFILSCFVWVFISLCLLFGYHDQGNDITYNQCSDIYQEKREKAALIGHGFDYAIEMGCKLNYKPFFKEDSHENTIAKAKALTMSVCEQNFGYPCKDIDFNKPELKNDSFLSQLTIINPLYLPIVILAEKLFSSPKENKNNAMEETRLSWFQENCAKSLEHTHHEKFLVYSGVEHNSKKYENVCLVKNKTLCSSYKRYLKEEGKTFRPQDHDENEIKTFYNHLCHNAQIKEPSLW